MPSIPAAAFGVAGWIAAWRQRRLHDESLRLLNEASGLSLYQQTLPLIETVQHTLSEAVIKNEECERARSEMREELAHQRSETTRALAEQKAAHERQIAELMLANANLSLKVAEHEQQLAAVKVDAVARTLPVTGGIGS